MTHQPRQRPKAGEVTGWYLVLAAVVVAALLAAMMLWAVGFMNSEFVTPARRRST